MQESELRAQNVEYLQAAPTPSPRATRKSNLPVPGFAPPSASTSQPGARPPIRPSESTPNAQPATLIINLTGFICQPGNSQYEKAAKAAGVTDKSPVYWFHEDAYEDWNEDDMGFSSRHVPMAETTSYKNARRVAIVKAGAEQMKKIKRKGMGAVVGKHNEVIKVNVDLDEEDRSSEK
jgi:hypothetical protein